MPSYYGYNPAQYQQDFSWIAKAGAQVSDTITKMPGLLEADRALRENKVKNIDLYKGWQQELESLSEDQVRDTWGMSKQSLLKVIEPGQRESGIDYMARTTKAVGGGLGQIRQQQRVLKRGEAITGAAQTAHGEFQTEGEALSKPTTRAEYRERAATLMPPGTTTKEAEESLAYSTGAARYPEMVTPKEQADIDYKTAQTGQAEARADLIKEQTITESQSRGAKIAALYKRGRGVVAGEKKDLAAQRDRLIDDMRTEQSLSIKNKNLVRSLNKAIDEIANKGAMQATTNEMLKTELQDSGYTGVFAEQNLRKALREVDASSVQINKNIKFMQEQKKLMDKTPALGTREAAAQVVRGKEQKVQDILSAFREHERKQSAAGYSKQDVINDVQRMFEVKGDVPEAETWDQAVEHWKSGTSPEPSYATGTGGATAAFSAAARQSAEKFVEDNSPSKRGTPEFQNDVKQVLDHWRNKGII